jgi:hypothetical protein
MEDVTLQVIDIRALPVSEGEEHATLVMLSASQAQTPFAGPDGQPLVLTIPSKITRVHLNKQAGQELIDSLQEAVDNLPDPKPTTNLVIPGSPADVDRVAANLKQFGA